MGLLGGILGDILKPITGIIDKAVVDKDEKKRIELEIAKLVDEADKRYHEELIAQTEVNKIEAAHPSIFVAGWRPAIGWIGAAGLGYSFVLAPFIEFGARAAGYVQEMPVPDTGQLMTLVMGMLGIGGLRTYEKYKGVDTKLIKPDK